MTFGVKVPEDLRDEINEMMKSSGLVGREFMQELVDSYMLDRNKQEIPEMAEEIRELQTLTHRINEMYLYLGTRFKNIIAVNEKEKEEIGNDVVKEKKAYQEEIEQYKNEVKTAKEESLKLQVELKKATGINKEAHDKIDELNGYNENYKELNNQYKDNIEKLTKKVDDLRHLKEENAKLVVGNKTLQENNDNLASELWFSKREVEELKEKLTKNKEENQRYISNLKQQYHLEKQTSILELQLESQKAIERLNSKTANMQTEYNDKLKQLLFNVESKENEHNKQSKQVEKKEKKNEN